MWNNSPLRIHFFALSYYFPIKTYLALIFRQQDLGQEHKEFSGEKRIEEWSQEWYWVEEKS